MSDKLIQPFPELRVLLPIPCPVCALAKSQLLEYPSKLARADIYQCALCGHVWAVPLKPANPSPSEVATRPLVR